MTFILPTFKGVSVVFAVSAIVTGMQAIVDPIGFSRSFGIPLTAAKDMGKSKSTTSSSTPKPDDNSVMYVSLMGVRQLATGLTLITFAYQQKWTEMATILSILGIVVAGTDGIYLSHSGAKGLAKVHAIPGALIALLAAATILADS